MDDIMRTESKPRTFDDDERANSFNLLWNTKIMLERYALKVFIFQLYNHKSTSKHKLYITVSIASISLIGICRLYYINIWDSFCLHDRWRCSFDFNMYGGTWSSNYDAGMRYQRLDVVSIAHTIRSNRDVNLGIWLDEWKLLYNYWPIQNYWPQGG